MVSRFSLLPIAAAFALLWSAMHVCPVAWSAPPEKIALTELRIIPVGGDEDEIANGTILIEHGKITAIGAKVEIPYDAVVVELPGKIAFPGMIDPHSARGLDVANESLPVTPFVDVYDALDPARLFFEDSLRDGITSVHTIPGDNCVIGGLSRLVRPIGMTPDTMTVKTAVALKLCTSPRRGSDRMLQMQSLRGTFAELEDYLERVAEERYEESVKRDGKTLDVGPAEARKRGRELVREEHLDDAHRNLARLKQGRLDAWIYAGAAMDVGPAIELARSQGFLEHTVLVLGGDAFRAIDELKAAQRPVVLAADLVFRDRDRATGEITEIFVPKLFYEAGLRFALQPHPDGSLAERYLTYQAARCVREGIPRRVALKAITLNPAKMLGCGDRFGSLEVGKTANVVIFSGDPLEFSSWVEHVYIDGILAYDRARDPRIQKLLPKPKDPARAAEPIDAPTPAPPVGDETPKPSGDGKGGGMRAESAGGNR
ncbi:MAG: amidohydrolase family protein [Planctomycetota bacterium]